MQSKPHIGNDVVDLCDPQAQHKADHYRFLTRVCHPEERQLITSAADPHVMLWTLWACKEASFKAIRKAMPNAPFIPNQYTCYPEKKAGYWRCAFRHLRCHAYIELISNCIHCIATLHTTIDQADIMSSCHETPAGADDSQAVRTQALELLAIRGYHDCHIVRLEQDGRLLPPQVLYKHQPLVGCDLSLSHDGRFIGSTLLFFSPSNGTACNLD